MRMLRDDWRGKGLEVEYEEVEGVGHEEKDVLGQVQGFVLKHLGWVCCRDKFGADGLDGWDDIFCIDSKPKA
jgi:hypothetical protein